MKTQFDNAGDALIIRELIRLVSSRVPTEVYLGNAPGEFVSMLAVDAGESVTAHRQDGYLAACRDMLRARLHGETCYYFLTPGGLNGEKSLKQFVAEGLRLGVLLSLALIGVRICQLGFSLERIGPRYARLLRWRSRFFHICAPRDQISARYAHELGIRTTGIAPDLSFNLFSSESIETPNGRGGIAFSFRVDKDASIRARIQSAALSICGSIDEDREIICVAQVGRDVAFMRELSESCSEVAPGRVRFVDCHQSIDEALRAYSACGTVYSNRLHVLMLALKAGAAPVALIDPHLDSKIVGLFHEIGMEDRILELSSADSRAITAGLGPVTFRGGTWARELTVFVDGIFSVKAA